MGGVALGLCFEVDEGGTVSGIDPKHQSWAAMPHSMAQP
jgi:hypothetical protein